MVRKDYSEHENDDPFGQMVWDFYKDKPSFEAVEMDTGFLTAISPGPEWYFDEYNEWPEAEQKAVDIAEGKVLDLGCGAGRHSLYLQEEHEVLAIDLSKLALKTARERGVENIEKLDIREIDSLEQKFDTVLLLGNNFGLVGGFEEGRKFFSKLDRVTSKKSKIIAEAKPCDSKKEEKQHEDKNGLIYLEMRYRYKEHVGNWHKLYYYTKEQLERLIKPTKWKISDYIESNDSSTYFAIIEKG